MPFPSNIPGLDIKVKLNSADVFTLEKREAWQQTINRLIYELVRGDFKIEMNIKQEQSFAISISGLPDKNCKSYRLNVDEGVFRMIYDGLYVVLSDNAVFRGVGQSYGTFEIPTLEVPDWNSLDLAIANNAEDVLFDLDRSGLHDFLYTLCVSFIIRHEIRHIANGHIDYLIDKRQVIFYENSRNGLEPIDSQTLEMDVDSCVFAGMIDGLFNITEQRARVPNLLNDERGIFSALFFCIQFLFYCMPSRKVKNIEEIQGASHPNAFMRYFFCYNTGCWFLKEKYPQYLDLYIELHQSNFWEFLYGLGNRNLINIERVMADHEWTISIEGLTFIDRISANWNKLKPLLEPFCYLRLAPYWNADDVL